MKKRLVSIRKTVRQRPAIVHIGQATLGLAIVFFIYNLITAVLDPVWQQWTFVGISALFLLACVIGVSWIRANRLRAGGWMLIIGMLFLATSAVLLYTDIALLAALIVAIYTLLVAPLTLPRREVNTAIVFGLNAGSAIYIADFFITTSRTAPLSPATAWGLALILVLLYAAYLVRAFPNLDLRTKYLLSTLLGVVFVILGLTTYFINTSTQNLTASVQQRLSATAQETANEIDNFIASTLRLARADSRLPTIQDFVLQEGNHTTEQQLDIATLLENLRSTNPAFIHSYTLVDIHGKVLANIPADVERSAYIKTLDTSYALRAQLEESFVSPIETHPDGRSTLAFVAQISDEENQPIGTIIIRYSTDLLQSLVSEYTGAGGPDSFAILLDNNQIILAHGESPQNRLQRLSDMTGIPAAELRDLAFRNTTQLSLDPNTTEPYFIAIHNLQSRPWQVLFTQPREVFLAPIRVQARTSSIISLAFLLGIAVIILTFANYLVRPLLDLTQVAERISAGDLSVRAVVRTKDEVGILASAFNQTVTQLQTLLTNLESQVAERTHQLEMRAELLRAGSEVAAAISNILSVDALITQVVNFIQTRFQLYYVGLFLVDARGEWAVLRAGTGLAGEKMLARGHRIQVGSGMIGWSILHGEPRIAQIAESDAVRLTAPELPNTRSEAALPLRSRGRILGALTIQSDKPNAFDEDTLTILQIMADQIAVALDNARLFEERENALQVAKRSFGEFTLQAWRDLVGGRPRWGYRYAQGILSPLDDTWSPLLERAVITKQPVASRDRHGPILAVPLLLRGTPVGALQFHKTPEALDWSPSEIQILQELSEQMALALENARQHQEIQRRAFQEGLRAELVSRLRQQNDLEHVLTTAADKIYTTLNLEEVTVQLFAPTTNGSSAHE